MRSRLPEPYLRAFDVEDGTICCRICLDSLNASDLSSGLAIKLGCRCSASGFDVMHRSCAAQWFGSIHQSSKCEVCSSEAVGLPTDVKDKIRSGTSSTPPLHPGPEAAPIATILDQLSSFPSVPAFLGNYSAFCLLPATITCITLTLFYMKVIEVDTGTGIGLTIGISALTILHWFLFPRKPLLHLLYVVGLVSSCICFTIVADCNFLSWTVTVRCVSGALMGAVIGTFLFYGIGIPIGALLAWCVLTRPARTGSSVRRLHDISVCYSPCIQCWRQLTCSMPAHTSLPLQRRRTAGSVDVVVGSYHGSGRMNPGDMMALPPSQGISYTSSTGSVAPCTSARTTSSMQEGVASTQAHEADTQYPIAGLQARDAAM